MLNNFCFHVYAHNSVLKPKIAMLFFDNTFSSSRPCEFRVHRAGSQLKSCNWRNCKMNPYNVYRSKTSLCALKSCRELFKSELTRNIQCKKQTMTTILRRRHNQWSLFRPQFLMKLLVALFGIGGYLFSHE